MVHNFQSIWTLYTCGPAAAGGGQDGGVQCRLEQQSPHRNCPGRLPCSGEHSLQPAGQAVQSRPPARACFRLRRVGMLRSFPHIWKNATSSPGTDEENVIIFGIYLRQPITTRRVQSVHGPIIPDVCCNSHHVLLLQFIGPYKYRQKLYINWWDNE